MMRFLPFLALLVLTPACGNSDGDGNVVMCSCDISYLSGNPVQANYEGSMDVPLCESTSTNNVYPSDAENACSNLVSTADIGSGNQHQCTCVCAHTAESCYTNK